MNVILLMEMMIQLIKYLFLVQWLDLDKVTLHAFISFERISGML